MAKKPRDLFYGLKAKPMKKGDKIEPKPKLVKKPKKVKKPRSPTDPRESSRWRYHQLRNLGIELEYCEVGPMFGMLAALRARKLTVEDVALKFGLDRWTRVYPSEKQIGLLKWKEVPGWNRCRCKHDASLLISAALNPEEFKERWLKELSEARSVAEVTAVAKDLGFVRFALLRAVYEELVVAGRTRREIVTEGIPQ